MGLKLAGKVRYLLNRNGRYYARLIVPKEIRPQLDNLTELREPLGSDRRIALSKLPGVVSAMQHRISLAQQQSAAADASSKSCRYPMTIDEMALQHYQLSDRFDLELRLHDYRYAQIGVDLDGAQRLREGMAGMLPNDELDDLVGDRIRRFKAAGNTVVEKGSVEWRQLAMALCTASYEAMEREAERNEGVFDGVPSNPKLIAITDSEPVAANTSFFSIIDTEVARRARGKNAKPLPASTIKKYRQAAADFVAFRGSDNAHTVTASEGKAWIEAMQNSGDLSNRTVKQKFQNVRTLQTWGRDHDPERFLPNGNSWIGLKTPDYTTTPSYKRAFTLVEAKKVLLAARAEQKPMLRWIPWLCAYSGMRVSEAGSLNKEDFFQVGERWFWRVTSAGGKTLKTASSERRIPVHKALLDEGLIDFVSNAQSGRLFRGDKRDAIKVQPRLSEWVRTLIPMTQRPELSPTHGWRHLFEDFCRRDGVPESARSYITGRASGGSSDEYGKSEVMLPGLAAAIDKIVPVEL